MTRNKGQKALFLMATLYHFAAQGLCTVYCSPKDDIKGHLIELIKAERKSIDGAMYMLTDKAIAQALVDAYVRGVQVTIVLDQVSMSQRLGKGIFLQQNGVTVFAYYGTSSNPFMMPIMHHKFFIFGLNDLYKKAVVWTGSFNCSVAAATLHDENVMICDEKQAVQRYQSCFMELIDRLGGKKHPPEKEVLSELVKDKVVEPDIKDTD